MEVPWAYAYFLAAFYRLFGVHPWIPIVVQAALNALVPLLVFTLARKWFNRETAVLAAVLTGICSFNTIYASTLSSDAVCTVIFMAAIVVFTRAVGGGGLAWFGLAGLLTGIAPQFRPNLILVPLLLVAYAVWVEPTRRRLTQVVVMLACTVLALTPWVVRNYRLTGIVLPTSVHGGVQLCAALFRSDRIFTAAPTTPIRVRGFGLRIHQPERRAHHRRRAARVRRKRSPASRWHWSDYDATERRLAPAMSTAATTTSRSRPRKRRRRPLLLCTGWSESQDAPFARRRWAARTRCSCISSTPIIWATWTRMATCSDVFDVGAWCGPRRGTTGAVRGQAPRRRRDEPTRCDALMRRLFPADAENVLTSMEFGRARARMTFSDGSTIVIPRSGRRITDWTFTGNVATTLMTSHSVQRDRSHAAASLVARRLRCRDAAIEVFTARASRWGDAGRWPSTMRRDPVGFALASGAGRAPVRLLGTSDRSTAQQFAQSRWIYMAGTGASILYVTLFGISVVVGVAASLPGRPAAVAHCVPAGDPRAGADQHADAHRPAADVHVHRGDDDRPHRRWGQWRHATIEPTTFNAETAEFAKASKSLRKTVYKR
jgi:hypothetical protein